MPPIASVPHLAALLVASQLLWFPRAAAAAKTNDDPKWCRVCHTEPAFSADGFGKSVHGDQVCRDCHEGYHFDPHQPVEEPDSPVPEALQQIAKHDARALAACLDCHDDIADDTGLVRHGSKPGSSHHLYCPDCHGDVHVIRAGKSLTAAQRRVAFNQGCINCHADAKRMKHAGLTTDPAESYADSMHARKLGFGSPAAPGCANCHGSHKLANLKEHAEVACVKCHAGAGSNFASLGTHAPWTSDGRPWGYYTQKFFAWLTFITILLLVIHVMLDLFSSLRLALTTDHRKA